MTIKVGNAPVSWGVMEVADWGEQIPYSKVLDEIAAAGYAGTELGPYGYFPTEPGELASQLSARGLQLVASFVLFPSLIPTDTSPVIRKQSRLLSCSRKPARH
jgi:inosose dehydratase